MYLKEKYYCSLHLRKNGVSITGQSPVLNIMRNSDNKYLKVSTSEWDDSPEDIDLDETTPGIYQYEIDMSTFNNNPETYTLIYKYDNNGVILEDSELVHYERKNRAKLV